MERSNEPPDIRRIKLTRSEPLVYLKKPNALTTARYTQQVPLVKKRHTQPPVKKDVDRKSKNPSQSVRPKVTVVSPKRKVRLSTTSSGDFSRSTADGESSPCSLDEERIFNTLKFRYPGDGCNSDSDSDTSDGDFDDDVDNYCGAQSADLFDDEEIYDDDDGATFEGMQHFICKFLLIRNQYYAYVVYASKIVEPFNVTRESKHRILSRGYCEGSKIKARRIDWN